MLSQTEKVCCGWCDKASLARDWNDVTFKECKSREMRREYTPIFNEKAFLRQSNTFYKCPICGRWLRGCQLRIVETDNPHLLKLGGESIIQIVDEEY